jgi:hypothetical protein
MNTNTSRKFSQLSPEAQRFQNAVLEAISPQFNPATDCCPQTQIFWGFRDEDELSLNEVFREWDKSPAAEPSLAQSGLAVTNVVRWGMAGFWPRCSSCGESIADVNDGILVFLNYGTEILLLHKSCDLKRVEASGERGSWLPLEHFLRNHFDVM